MPSPTPPIRTGIKRAIAWNTAREIIGHPPSLDLRIDETHPGGGQYDCLTVVAWPSLDTVCSFNLAGESLEVGTPRAATAAPLRHDGFPTTYVEQGLGEDRSALPRVICRMAGLDFSPTPRPSNPTDLTLSVVGTLLDRVALGPRDIDLRCGWHDDVYGADTRPWARSLPACAALAADVDWRAKMGAACRYWSLQREGDSNAPRVIVDVASSRWWADGQSQPPFATGYAQGSGIRELSWALERVLDLSP